MPSSQRPHTVRIPSLAMRFFGDLDLRWGTTPLVLRVPPKVLELLAYLVLHRDRAHSRDDVAFLLWPDTPERAARANLRRHLHELTTVLPASDPPWLDADRRTVVWRDALPTWVDVHAFTSCVHVDGRAAAALYRGDLLPRLDALWIVPLRERLRATICEVLEALVERERTAGDARAALVYAERILDLDPLREDVVRTVMQLRHGLGDRVRALRTYHRFADGLRAELDVEPMPETIALATSVSGTPLKVR